MKKLLYILIGFLVLLTLIVTGGSFYMLDYSLAPDANRMDRDSCLQQQFAAYP